MKTEQRTNKISEEIALVFIIIGFPISILSVILSRFIILGWIMGILSLSGLIFYLIKKETKLKK